MSRPNNPLLRRQEPPPASVTAPLRFRGGTAGALAPLGLFLADVSWLGLSGALLAVVLLAIATGWGREDLTS